MSYQEAYLYALEVKKVCDELSYDHMSVLKEKIDAVDDEDFLDYFAGYSRYLTTLDRDPVTGNTYENSRMVEYSDFIRDVNATVPMGESFTIGLTALAKTIVFTGALVAATYVGAYASMYVAQVVVDAGLTAQMLYGAAKYAFTGNIVTYTNALFSDKWNLFTAGPWELFDKPSNTGTDVLDDVVEMYRMNGIDIDVDAMSEEQLNNIVKHFQEQGGVIQMDDATDAYLASKNAEAITYNENTILLKQKPGKASVYEELIHSTQFRNGQIDGSAISRIQAEIAAQEKLLKFADVYGLTPNEIEQTQLALQSYLEELFSIIKRR